MGSLMSSLCFLFFYLVNMYHKMLYYTCTIQHVYNLAYLELAGNAIGVEILLCDSSYVSDILGHAAAV